MDSKHQAFLISTAVAAVLTVLMTVWTSILWARLNASTIRVNNLIVKNDFTTTSNVVRANSGAKASTVVSTSLYAYDGYGTNFQANSSNFTRAAASTFIFDNVTNANSYFVDNLVVGNLSVSAKSTFDQVTQNGQILTFSPSQLACATINAPEAAVRTLNASNITATTATVTGKLSTRDLQADAANFTDFQTAVLSSASVTTSTQFTASSSGTVQVKRISSSADVTFSGTSQIDRLNRIVSNGTVTANATSFSISGDVSVQNKIICATAEVGSLTASTVSSGNYASTQNFSFSEITTQTLNSNSVVSNQANFSQNINASTMQSNYTKIGATNVIEQGRVVLNRVEIGQMQIYDNYIVSPTLALSANALNLATVSNAGACAFAQGAFTQLTGMNGATVQNITTALSSSNFTATNLTAARWDISGSISATQYTDSAGKVSISKTANGTVIDCGQMQANRTMYRTATGKNNVTCANP